MKTKKPPTKQDQKPASNGIQKILASRVQLARQNAQSLLVGLPWQVKTKAQRRLKALHGTPLEFGRGCIEALGEITYAECHNAIVKYEREWNEAGRK